MIVDVSSHNFHTEVLEEEKTVLLDFSATWCGPCKMISPFVDQIAEELKETVKVCKIDIDKDPGLAKKFKVMSIPTILVVKNGTVVNRSIGFIPKDKIFGMLS